MRIIRGATKHWSTERGYERGILLPFPNEISAPVQIQETNIPARSYVPRHFHKSQTEFIYITRGECVFIFDTTEVTVQTGDLLIIEPGDTHATKNDSATDVLLVTFKLGPTTEDTFWVNDPRIEAT